MDQPPFDTANLSHGHVRPRADGFKARCGGPGLCKVCTFEARTHSEDHPYPPTMSGGHARDAAIAHPEGYRSTSCRHDNHDYCQSSIVRAIANPDSPRPMPTVIPKDPAQCKFCGAPCTCQCHTDARRTELADEVCGWLRTAMINRPNATLQSLMDDIVRLYTPKPDITGPTDKDPRP